MFLGDFLSDFDYTGEHQSNSGPPEERQIIQGKNNLQRIHSAKRTGFNPFGNILNQPDLKEGKSVYYLLTSS